MTTKVKFLTLNSKFMLQKGTFKQLNYRFVHF